MDQTPPRLPEPADPPYDAGMDARMAALEQIAKETRDALVRLRRGDFSATGRGLA